jgi:hypothetical protein
MSTSVYLKLTDGRSLPLKEGAQQAVAAIIKEHFERWIKAGMTLSVANAHGEVEEITPRRVLAIEVVEMPDP